MELLGYPHDSRQIHRQTHSNITDTTTTNTKNNNNNNNNNIHDTDINSFIDIKHNRLHHPAKTGRQVDTGTNGNMNIDVNNIFDSTLPFITNDNNLTSATTASTMLTSDLLHNNHHHHHHHHQHNYNNNALTLNTTDTTNINDTFSSLFPHSNLTHTPISRQELEQYILFNIAVYMNRYYLWVVFALGFPGNVVSFVTILKMKPYTSPTMYIAGLALVDNTCLVCKLAFFLLTKHDVYLGHDGCGVLIFFGVFSAQLANWLLVAMTVERCLAICLPLKVGSICTRKVHVLGLILIGVCLGGINAQNFFTNMMFDHNGNLSCDTNPAYQDFMKVWWWVDAVFYSFLPSALLIVMNTLLIMGIRRSAKIQREMTSKASQAAEGMRQQRQITIMLVIVCVVFVLLITPNALFYAIKPNWNYQKSALETAKYRFTQQFIFVLCDSTHAVNFYLYFFSTRRFRTRCLETTFFCCCLSKRRRARSYHYTTATTRTGAGSSACFRMSMTEVTAVPGNGNGGGNGNTHNALPLRQYSSSSTSSASSMGRGGRHVVVRNGGGGGGGKKFYIGGGGKKTTFKSKRKYNGDSVECKKYELV